MTRTLSIHEAAEIEMNESADDDDLENTGLGNIFVDEIQKAVETILEFGGRAAHSRTSQKKIPL